MGTDENQIKTTKRALLRAVNALRVVGLDHPGTELQRWCFKEANECESMAIKNKQEAALDELVKQAQELGLGY